MRKGAGKKTAEWISITSRTHSHPAARPVQPGGKGVIVMDLDKGDSLAGAIVTAQPNVMFELKGGRKLSIKDAGLQDYFGKRARKGKLLGLKRKGEVSGFSVA